MKVFFENEHCVMDTSLLRFYEPLRNEFLLSQWNASQRVIDIVLYKCSWFIARHEYDDYKQEMFIQVWKRFDTWFETKDRGFTFEQWLFRECRTAAYTYRSKLLHVSMQNRKIAKLGRYLYTDKMEALTEVNEEYDESMFDSLKKAIQDLPASDQKIVNLVLDGENLSISAAKDGLSPSHYKHRFQVIKDKIRKHKNKYFEDMPVYLKAKRRREHLRNSNNRLSKPVIQLSINGDQIKVWSSAVEAERSGGFTASHIQAAAKGRCVSHKGYRWVYVGETNHAVLARKKKEVPKCAVIQRSIDGGVLRTYPSLKEAKEKGFDRGGILRAASGITPSYKGYQWQVANNETQAI